MTDITIAGDGGITLFVNEGIPDSTYVTVGGVQTLTNKTITFDDNTLTGVQPELESGTSIKTVNGESVLGSGDITTLSTDVGNESITNIKTISFDAQPLISTTSGAITIDWSAAQNYKQSALTAGVDYTFVDPPGPCHLQLFVEAGTAQAINFPTNVNWLIFTWVGVDNKAAVINFWFDGTNYWAMGSNEV